PFKGAPSPSKFRRATEFSTCAVASGRSALALRASPVKVQPMPSPVSKGWLGSAQISPCTFLARSLAPGWKAARAARTQPEGVKAYCPFCQEKTPCPARSVPCSMAKLKCVEKAAWLVKPPPLHSKSRSASLAEVRPGPDRLGCHAACKLSLLPDSVRPDTRAVAPLPPVHSKGRLAANSSLPPRYSA